MLKVRETNGRNGFTPTFSPLGFYLSAKFLRLIFLRHTRLGVSSEPW